METTTTDNIQIYCERCGYAMPFRATYRCLQCDGRNFSLEQEPEWQEVFKAWLIRNTSIYLHSGASTVATFLVSDPKVVDRWLEFRQRLLDYGSLPLPAAAGIPVREHYLHCVAAQSSLLKSPKAIDEFLILFPIFRKLIFGYEQHLTEKRRERGAT